MSASKPPEVQFTAKCYQCGSRMPITRLEIIKTALGPRLTCSNCRQLWLLATRKLGTNPHDA